MAETWTDLIYRAINQGKALEPTDEMPETPSTALFGPAASASAYDMLAKSTEGRGYTDEGMVDSLGSYYDTPDPMPPTVTPPQRMPSAAPPPAPASTGAKGGMDWGDVFSSAITAAAGPIALALSKKDRPPSFAPSARGLGGGGGVKMAGSVAGAAPRVNPGIIKQFLRR